MVVTDLHGNYSVYCRYRDHFHQLRAEGKADTLIFCGDLIHSEGSAETDGSLEIVLDLIRLRRELGERLTVLLGNHELPHLYGIIISKGDITYTPRFEIAMGARRAEILAFFDDLPFFIRTRAGVAIAHTGASAAAASAEGFRRLASYSHSAELNGVNELLKGADMISLRAEIESANAEPYAELARRNFGVTDPYDPRYDDMIRGAFVSQISANFQLLWDATFNKNEGEYGSDRYEAYLNAFLANLSKGYARQHTLVSGHIQIRCGHKITAGKQLRLASWAHATPPEAGEYLLFDAGWPTAEIEDVMEGLGSVF